eukprot:4603829-Pyramimonas_sp.AAC.1
MGRRVTYLSADAARLFFYDWWCQGKPTVMKYMSDEHKQILRTITYLRGGLYGAPARHAALEARALTSDLTRADAL